MAARLKALGVPPEKIKVIGNWADRALISPLPPNESALRQEWMPGDRFVVGYAGNLGRAHDIDTVLAAMTLLHERAKKRAFGSRGQGHVCVYRRRRQARPP